MGAWSSLRGWIGGLGLSRRVIVTYPILATVALLGIIQLVPYGRQHSNPPVTGEPAWATPETRDLMVRACYGCHSNEVDWPWYSNIAPLSWVITNHVDEARDEVNYSEFGSGHQEADDTIETILDGSMPPASYTLFGLHPEANLSDEERAALVSGLRATPGLDEEEHEDEDEDEEHDDDD